MPNFVWTVKDPAGKPAVREVTAHTARESRAILEAEGCTDLVLKSDEIIGEAMASFEKSEFLGEEIKVTQTEALKHRGKPPPTFFRLLIDSVVQSIWLYLLLVGLAVLEYYRGRYAMLAVVVAAMVGWPVFRVWVGLPQVYYNKLIKAREWHRWPEVMQIVERLEKSNQSHFLKIPAPELARSRALALAGTGKLNEAVDYFRRFENQPGVPSWLYKAYLASIFDTAKQHDAAIQCSEAAVAEKPSSAMCLDLAMRRLHRKKDVSGGREALRMADQEEITDIARPFQHCCRGILAYLEGKDTEARKEFEAALAILKTTPHQPFIEANTALTKAYLACVLARQGDLPAARKMFAEAKDYLEAAEETVLLAECNRMVT